MNTKQKTKVPKEPPDMVSLFDIFMGLIPPPIQEEPSSDSPDLTDPPKGDKPQLPTIKPGCDLNISSGNITVSEYIENEFLILANALHHVYTRYQHLMEGGTSKGRGVVQGEILQKIHKYSTITPEQLYEYGDISEYTDCVITSTEPYYHKHKGWRGTILHLKKKESDPNSDTTNNDPLTDLVWIPESPGFVRPTFYTINPQGAIEKVRGVFKKKTVKTKHSTGGHDPHQKVRRGSKKEPTPPVETVPDIFYPSVDLGSE